MLYLVLLLLVLHLLQLLYRFIHSQAILEKQRLRSISVTSDLSPLAASASDSEQQHKFTRSQTTR